MNMERRITSREVGESSYSYFRDKELVHIGAYCLMPNHFHILLTQKIDKGISKFMLKLSTAYVMYFNKKYKRTGGLFEGRFKSKHIDNDRYLKYLYSYIHLNPIKLIKPSWKEEIHSKKKIFIDYIKKYAFSSTNYYLGENVIENKIINIEGFPNYFPTKGLFLKDIFSWIILEN